MRFSTCTIFTALAAAVAVHAMPMPMGGDSASFDLVDREVDELDVRDFKEVRSESFDELISRALEDIDFLIARAGTPSPPPAYGQNQGTRRLTGTTPPPPYNHGVRQGEPTIQLPPPSSGGGRTIRRVAGNSDLRGAARGGRSLEEVDLITRAGTPSPPPAYGQNQGTRRISGNTPPPSYNQGGRQGTPAVQPPPSGGRTIRRVAGNSNLRGGSSGNGGRSLEEIIDLITRAGTPSPPPAYGQNQGTRRISGNTPPPSYNQGGRQGTPAVQPPPSGGRTIRRVAGNSNLRGGSSGSGGR